MRIFDTRRLNIKFYNYNFTTPIPVCQEVFAIVFAGGAILSLSLAGMCAILSLALRRQGAAKRQAVSHTPRKGVRRMPITLTLHIGNHTMSRGSGICRERDWYFLSYNGAFGTVIQ